MGSKPGLLSIVGTCLFITGILVVLAILAVWWLAPIVVPANFGDENGYARAPDSYLGPDTPALRPYSAPPTADPHTQSPQPPTAHPETTPMTNESGRLDSETNWRVLSYPEGNHEKPTSSLAGRYPMRLAIPALQIDAPILPVSLGAASESGSRTYQQWAVPNQHAAGWHNSSARPGELGNIVLNGHNNIHGAIFRNLVDLPLGAEITLYDAGKSHVYRVTGREFLLERGEPLRNRLKNARWILPTNDNRLTLVTCWPNSSNSHRLVVVAHAVENS